MTIDVLLIGGGIMSATLGMLLKAMRPDLKTLMLERLDRVAGESSEAWNNAGTGHAAYCELNYTPEVENGQISIEKAVKIAAQFEVSKAFWASLAARGVLNPHDFIHTVPHHSLVWGERGVSFLRRRFVALHAHPLFAEMKFSEDPRQISTWIPLTIQGRAAGQPIAATRMNRGTDVDFGALTQSLVHALRREAGFALQLTQEVRDLHQQPDGTWKVVVQDLMTDETREHVARFVFIGAGGGSLPLLEQANLPEAEGYGGFPVSGMWLRCAHQDVTDRHMAKVYGQAELGAPPMSVPHLDTRFIRGKKALLFGPFAGFSTKFLKHGSYFDLPRSVEPENVFSMLSAGWQNLGLTQYLIEQVRLTHEERMAALRMYLPEARNEDWTLEVAGQRVQVIRPDAEKGGILAFGTEIITAKDGSMAALLGASPGASTAVSAMLTVVERCFPDLWHDAAATAVREQLIPCLSAHWEDPHVVREHRTRADQLLKLGVYGKT